MKKAMIVLVLLTQGPLDLSAGGINISWNDCGTSGAMNRDFACDNNTTFHDIYMSFEPPQSMSQIVGCNQFIDVEAASATLPDWWQFKNAGSCRSFELTTPALTPSSCVDPWQGSEAPGIAAYLVTANTPSMPVHRARIVGSVAVPGSGATQVNPGTEYHAMAIRIRSGKTVGADACGGCTVDVCLVLNGFTLYDNSGNDYAITTVLSRHFITWQGGVIPLGCAGVVPASQRTWGQVKSIYR
ncbi:MAG TPA: hypothetical protein VJY35_10960 [Candidatus Eisenbacteria bacterium]|nr:hypothetical protein [Candidatus Eisenbacteria bacterium]